jgi:hypothetical protein
MLKEIAYFVSIDRNEVSHTPDHYLVKGPGVGKKAQGEGLRAQSEEQFSKNI